MIGFVIAIHVIICLFLIVVILIQAGRGGGLVESLSGVESVFGTKTSAFLTRTTSVLAVLFFITCISLALLSARQSKSLMRSVKPQNVIPAEAVKEVPAAGSSVTPEVTPQPQSVDAQQSE